MRVHICVSASPSASTARNSPSAALLLAEVCLEKVCGAEVGDPALLLGDARPGQALQAFDRLRPLFERHVNLRCERQRTRMLRFRGEQLIEDFECPGPIAEPAKQAGAFVEQIEAILRAAQGKPVGHERFECFGVFLLCEQVVQAAEGDVPRGVFLERTPEEVFRLLVLLEAIQSHDAGLLQ